MKHVTVPLVAAALGSALAGSAHAADPESHFSLGLTLSLSIGPGEPRVGFGFDLRGGFAVKDDTYWGGGVFVQGLLMPGGGRLALGLHGGALFSKAEEGGGLEGEIGWAYREEAPGGLAGAHGLHLGMLFSALGIAELHLRSTIYAVEALRPHIEGEAIVGFGLRYPNPIATTSCHCDVGRPYRVAGRALQPRVAFGRSVAQADLEPMTRAALAHAWLDDARSEAASVPAFEVLARDLQTLGAPASLVRRALRSARDEVRHARMCAKLAARYGGRTVSVERLTPAPSRPTFATLVSEAWHDGVLSEGAAAARARRAAHARDPEASAVHRAIAHDEGQHAELAWDTLRFALAHGGAAARDALAHARASTRPPPHAPTSAVDEAAWRDHSRVDAAASDDAWHETYERALTCAKALT